MPVTDQSKFSAVDSTLGYLFQCRFALLSTLQRIGDADDFQIKLEALEDVEFNSDGSAHELLQLKHHRSGKANLTDASTDIWKTLRIWSEGWADGTIPPNSLLYLVTTSLAPNNSAASYLRIEKRDPDQALERLAATLRTSTNKNNQSGYEAFKELPQKNRRELLDHIYIIDSAPDIIDLEKDLIKEIRYATAPPHRANFLNMLEGWWYRRILRQLTTPDDFIFSGEVDAYVGDLREQFSREGLPIDEDIMDAKIDHTIYDDNVFVQQLNLIGIGAQRVIAAIREYYRACEHRSKWLREDLLFSSDLSFYERRLVEEWSLVFERMRDELSEEAAEEEMLKAARDVYKWVETTVLPIRPKVTEPFVTRGTYQILADKLRVGWHPEFMARLGHLLEPNGISA